MEVLVISEQCTSFSNHESSVIGVASSKENALKMIKTHFGQDFCKIVNINDIRDRRVLFDCEVNDEDGDKYYVWVSYFKIDKP